MTAFFITAYPHLASAQTSFNYDKTQYAIPPMPEASSLGKYGEQNISLYTGKVNVNIPIYTISSHDINLPISISYATGGVKVQDMASQVGLGWVLSAGGVITRSVKGGADDAAGFVTTHGANMPAPGGAISEIGPNGGDGQEKLHNFMTGNNDGESDIYNYNFAGISGSFFFDRNGIIHSKDVNNLKFSYTSGSKDGMYGFIFFQIVDENGTTYIFDTLENQYTCSTSTTTGNIEDTSFGPYNCGGAAHISSWYLSKIISPQNNVLTLEYENFSQEHYEIPGSQVRYMIDESVTDPTYRQYVKKSFKTKMTTNSDHAKRLTRILGDNIEVDFLKGALRQDLVSNYALGGIQVKDAAGNLIHNYTFDYTYTNGDPRLQLQAFNEVAIDGSGQKKTYKFTYDGNPLPSRFSNGMDHWGYSNGQDNMNTHLIPTTVVGDVNYSGANRDANPTAAIAGSLLKVQYPTGGFQQYQYEGNTAWTSFPVTNQVGHNIRFDIFAYNGFPGMDWNSCSIITESYKDFTVDNSVWATIFLSMPYDNADPINPDVSWELWNMDTNTMLLDNNSYVQTSHPLGSNTYYYVYDRNGVGFNLQSGVHYRILHKMKPCRYNRNATYYNFQLGWSETVTNTQTSDITAGGLRVKSITNFDADGTQTEKHEYVYKDGTHSSGYLPFYPTYFSKYTESVVAYKEMNLPSGGKDYITVQGTCRVGKSQPFYLGMTQNTAVGYSNVDEIINGDQKISYSYHSPKDVKDAMDMGNGNYFALDEYNYNNILYDKSYLEFVSNDWARGGLIQKIVYKTDNGTYVPVQKESYNYDLTYSDSSSTYQGESYFKVNCTMNDRANDELLSNGYRVLPSGFGSYFYNQYWYKVHNSKSYLKSVTTETANSNDLTKWSAKTAFYEYSPVCALTTKEKHLSSKGDSIIVNYTYPLDLAQNQTLDETLGIKGMVTKNIVGQPVETTTQLKRADGSTKTLFSKLISRKQDTSLPDIIFETESQIPMPDFQAVHVTSSHVEKSGYYKPQVSVNQYDTFGNVTEQQQIDGVIQSFMWGYVGHYPIVQAMNAKVKNIFFDGFENGGGNSAVNDSYTGHYSYMGTYSKNLNGLDAGSYVLTYRQKVSGKWSLISTPVTVTGMSYSIALGSSTSQIDDVRFYPVNAQMTTYTYDPLIGVTSVSDAKGFPSYYEYDSFQRLRNIKDYQGNIIKSFDYNYRPQ